MSTKSISLFYTKMNRFLTKCIIALLVSSFVLYQGARILWGEHYMTFFKGIVRNPLQVGAFSPCSVFVAQEITKYVASDTKQGSLRVLEVGAGSGVLTTDLEKALQKRGGEYILDVIEIDPEYAALLKKRFENNKNVAIHCIDINDFNVEQRYDYLISTLPFNVMDNSVIKQIFQQYEKMVAPNGVLSYVEHMWLPDIKEKTLSGTEKQAFIEKRTIVNSFKDKYLVETVNVYRNITPLYVHHLKIVD